MATSLAVPIAYITVLVTALAIFSRIYRRRRAGKYHRRHHHHRHYSHCDLCDNPLNRNPPPSASPIHINKFLSPALIWIQYTDTCTEEKRSFEPWFPAHPARDIYITLLSADPSVPESMLKSALLVRATADVKRIWRIKEDKQTLNGLHERGLVGDDTMARFAAAEKELEAEIVDVVSEANTFRPGWGAMIFATASEMAHAEKTRETVINIAKVKALEGE
jgi:translocation protein SEC66